MTPLDPPGRVTEAEARPAGVLDVRCCCEPRRLLGWLPVPAGAARRPGVRVRFALVQDGPYDPPARWLESRHAIAAPPFELPDWLELTIDQYGDRAFVALAYRAEGVPIALLRRVLGFVEVPDRRVRR